MNLFRICFLVILGMATSSNIAFSQSNQETAQVEADKTISVKVKGVGCSKDIKSISTNVENLEGVSSCKILKKGATTTFEVMLSPSMVTEEANHAAIEGTAGCQNPNDRPYKVK